MSDWQKGDLALSLFDGANSGAVKGAIYVVADVLGPFDNWSTGSRGVGLVFAEIKHDENVEYSGMFWHGLFRKIRPSSIKHIEALKDIPVHVRENEHASS